MRFVMLSVAIWATMSVSAFAQTWDGDAGGLTPDSWGDVGNWSGGLPVANGSPLLDVDLLPAGGSTTATVRVSPLNVGLAFNTVNVRNGMSIVVGEVVPVTFRTNNMAFLGDGNVLSVGNNHVFGGANVNSGANVSISSGSTTISGVGDINITTLNNTGGTMNLNGSDIEILTSLSGSAGTTNVNASIDAAAMNVTGGTVNVESGDTLTVTGTANINGNNAASELNLNGAGVFGNINVTGGTNGSTLTVANSGSFDASGTTTFNGGIGVFNGDADFVALNLSNSAVVTAGGGDTEFDVSGDLDVASSSQFNVAGDSVNVTGVVDIGGSGEIDVQAGSLTATGKTTNAGGTLTVTSTANLNGGYDQSSGTTDIEAGGTLNGSASALTGGVINAAGTLNATTFDQSAGSVNVTGNVNASDASTISAGDFVIGIDGGASGAADFDSTLDISGGSTLVNIDNGSLTVDGLLSVADAELRLGAGGTLNANGGLTVSSGSVTGNGNVTGSITHDAGILSPGIASGLDDGSEFGDLAVNGDFTINGGSIEIDLGGAPETGDFDTVTVDGNVFIEGGQINVSLLNGLNTDELPNFVTNWDVITIDGDTTLNVALDSFFVDVSDKGLKWDFSGFNQTGGGTIRLQAVPEPGAYLAGGVLVLGMMFVGWRRRRKQNVAQAA